MGSVSVKIRRMKEGLGALGGAQSWNFIPRVIKDLQKLALMVNHLREGTFVLCRWCDIALGRMAIVSMRFSIGSSLDTWSSLNASLNLIVPVGLAGSDGSPMGGLKPAASAAKSRLLG